MMDELRFEERKELDNFNREKALFDGLDDFTIKVLKAREDSVSALMEKNSWSRKQAEEFCNMVDKADAQQSPYNPTYPEGSQYEEDILEAFDDSEPFQYVNCDPGELQALRGAYITEIEYEDSGEDILFIRAVKNEPHGLKRIEFAIENGLYHTRVK